MNTQRQLVFIFFVILNLFIFHLTAQGVQPSADKKDQASADKKDQASADKKDQQPPVETKRETPTPQTQKPAEKDNSENEKQTRDAAELKSTLAQKETEIKQHKQKQQDLEHQVADLQKQLTQQKQEVQKLKQQQQQQHQSQSTQSTKKELSESDLPDLFSKIFHILKNSAEKRFSTLNNAIHTYFKPHFDKYYPIVKENVEQLNEEGQKQFEETHRDLSKLAHETLDDFPEIYSEVQPHLSNIVWFGMLYVVLVSVFVPFLLFCYCCCCRRSSSKPKRQGASSNSAANSTSGSTSSSPATNSTSGSTSSTTKATTTTAKKKVATPQKINK